MSKARRRLIIALAVLSMCMTAPAGAAGKRLEDSAHAANSPVGVWVGTTDDNEYPVPFQLELAIYPSGVQGSLINGTKRSDSTSGSYADGHLTLHFDYYANTLEAAITDGVLTGTFSGRGHSIPIKAQLNGKQAAPDAHPPQIGGLWNVAVDHGTKGEHGWKLRVRQNGPHVDAVIERIDGDTGDLYGIWRNGAFAVSHFTAAGPSFAILRPQADGTLRLETPAHGGAVQSYPAHRTSNARQVALQTEDDPLRHTYLKNPNEPLSFRFPDLTGKSVSNTDPAFHHKALIVSIGGSWCPNCQDEAPFLEQLYRKYHDRGLEIIELSFEEASQLQNPVRLKAVIQRYGITYPVLIAGTPDQLNEKFPHVVNLNCWPTTFFVGRDGHVKAIHTGYAGPATESDNSKLESELTALVTRLLADKDANGQAKGPQTARSH
jgi:thiol-disulfide isomerase/thioredoxin